MNDDSYVRAINTAIWELRAIRELLEWQKADILAQRGQEEQKMDDLITRTAAAAKNAGLEAQRQAYAEHVALYHLKGPVGNA